MLTNQTGSKRHNKNKLKKIVNQFKNIALQSLGISFTNLAVVCFNRILFFRSSLVTIISTGGIKISTGNYFVFVF